MAFTQQPPLTFTDISQSNCTVWDCAAIFMWWLLLQLLYGLRKLLLLLLGAFIAVPHPLLTKLQPLPLSSEACHAPTDTHTYRHSIICRIGCITTGQHAVANVQRHTTWDQIVVDPGSSHYRSADSWRLNHHCFVFLLLRPAAGTLVSMEGS